MQQATKSSFHNEAQAVGTRRPARCGVLSRVHSAAMDAPCVLASHSSDTPRQRVVIAK